MVATVRLPFPLTEFTGSQRRLTLDWEGGSLMQMIEELISRWGEGLRDELLDESGKLDTLYPVFVNGIRVADLEAEISKDAEVYILVAISGG